MKFYVCKHCGNIITFEENKGVPVVCCGEKMKELLPNTVEASGEKHLPAVTVEDGAPKNLSTLNSYLISFKSVSEGFSFPLSILLICA